MTFHDWYDANLQRLLKGNLHDALQEAWQAAQKAERERTDECVDELLDYVIHDSWRCGYNNECHCGLNAITEKYDLPPVPLPEKGDAK